MYFLENELITFIKKMNIVSMMIYSATTQTEATLTKLACTKT